MSQVYSRAKASKKPLRDGIIPDTWTSANVIRVPKVNPPKTTEKDVRPIYLTQIVSKTLESIILNIVNDKFEKIH